MQSDARYLPKIYWRLYGVIIKIDDYSIGSAQIDDEIKGKLNFPICPNSTISLLVSRSDMPNWGCFSIGGMINKDDAILDIWHIWRNHNFTQSLTVNNLPSSFLFNS